MKPPRHERDLEALQALRGCSTLQCTPPRRAGRPRVSFADSASLLLPSAFFRPFQYSYRLFYSFHPFSTLCLSPALTLGVNAALQFFSLVFSGRPGGPAQSVSPPRVPTVVVTTPGTCSSHPDAPGLSSPPRPWARAGFCRLQGSASPIVPRRSVLSPSAGIAAGSSDNEAGLSPTEHDARWWTQAA